MKAPSDHMRTLKRRVDFLKSREHKNSFDLAELGALEWAIVNLQPQPAPVQDCFWKREGYKECPAAQPAVPDAIHHTDLSEHPEYIQGWNDYRKAMMEMLK
jgi:hypothetical protein